MLLKLILLFVLVPIGELALLIEIGRYIGVWPTIGIVVVTGIIGSFLLKQQGLSTWRRFQNDLSRGGFPGNIILEGVLLLVGGAFLLTPGVVTDALGFILLIPPSRKLVLKGLKAYLKRKFDLNEFIYIAPDDKPPEQEQPLDPSKRIN
ncbi:membrane protein FxsA [bacterium]|nr:MAG: membrane protein FxsA [bacterium]